MNRFAKLVKSLAAWLLALMTFTSAPGHGDERNVPFWVAFPLLLACLVVLAMFIYIAITWLIS